MTTPEGIDPKAVDEALRVYFGEEWDPIEPERNSDHAQMSEAIAAYLRHRASGAGQSAPPPPTPERLEAARVEQMRTLRDWAHDCADTSEATAKAKGNGDDYDQDIAPSFAARGRAFRECADRINGLLALPVPGQSRPAQPPEGIDAVRAERDAVTTIKDEALLDWRRAQAEVDRLRRERAQDHETYNRHVESAMRRIADLERALIRANTALVAVQPITIAATPEAVDAPMPIDRVLAIARKEWDRQSAAATAPPTPEGIDDRDQRTGVEIATFQGGVRDMLYDLVQRLGLRGDVIDGSGCDSGDWMAFTLAEVRQAYTAVVDAIDEGKVLVAPTPGALTPQWIADTREAAALLVGAADWIMREVVHQENRIGQEQTHARDLARAVRDQAKRMLAGLPAVKQ